jgi:hypothetical protein
MLSCGKEPHSVDRGEEGTPAGDDEQTGLEITIHESGDFENSPIFRAFLSLQTEVSSYCRCSLFRKGKEVIKARSQRCTLSPTMD